MAALVSDPSSSSLGRSPELLFARTKPRAPLDLSLRRPHLAPLPLSCPFSLGQGKPQPPRAAATFIHGTTLRRRSHCLSFPLDQKLGSATLLRSEFLLRLQQSPELSDLLGPTSAASTPPFLLRSSPSLSDRDAKLDLLPFSLTHENTQRNLFCSI